MTDPRSQYLEREQHRLSGNVLKSQRINSLDDIKLAIHKLKNTSRGDKTSVVSTKVLDANTVVDVSATVRDITPYTMIREALDGIKIKEEAAKNIVSTNNLKITSEGFNKIDPLIGRYLGGYRSGHLICWDIGQDRYSYDITTDKLTRTSTSGSV